MSENNVRDNVREYGDKNANSSDLCFDFERESKLKLRELTPEEQAFLCDKCINGCFPSWEGAMDPESPLYYKNFGEIEAIDLSDLPKKSETNI